MVEKAIQVSLLGAILVGGLFTVLGKTIGQVLYKDSLVGLLLQILGPLTPFMYLDSIVNGMLKGVGEQIHSLWFCVIDSIVRILLIWLLLPRYGLIGFLFVMLVSNLLTCSLSTNRLLIVTHSRIHWNEWVWKPLLSAGIAGLACYPLPLDGLTYALIGTIVFSAIYCLLLLIFQCVTPEDWQPFILKKS